MFLLYTSSHCFSFSCHHIVSLISVGTLFIFWRFECDNIFRWHFDCFMYNLFNNVQSILNKMVLFPFHHWHTVLAKWQPWCRLAYCLFVSGFVAKILALVFVCEERETFTMINDIVFHTYDSLLQLFYCIYKSFSPRKAASFHLPFTKNELHKWH